jgi:hypothetical protein
MLKTDDIEVLRTQFAAWMQGVDARFLGIMESECPHPSRTAAGDAWENGWGVCNRHLNDTIGRYEASVLKMLQR